MKKEGFVLLIIVSIFFVNFISSASIEDTIHLNIQTVNSSEDVVTGTFHFEFNISTSEDCANVVYSNSTNLTTDSRGIISYYLENTNLNYSDQYWLCYYRDGTLINASKIARNPYSFSARNTDFLDGYDSSYFMPLNTSVSGDFDFNQGWQNGGLSIVGGKLFAQTIYVYNLSSLRVNTLSINGSILPPVGFDNTFDIGSSSLRWRDLFLSGQVYSNGTGNNYFLGNVGIGTTAPAYLLEVANSATALNVSGNLYANSTNVGIGTSTPTSELEVSGNITVSECIIFSSGGQICGV